MTKSQQSIDWPTFNADEQPIESLLKLSRYYGADPSFVIAGGGNTSVKIGDRLHVKASGFAMATLSAEGLVELDRTKLDEVAASDFGSDREEREAKYKAGIMGARLEPDKGQRPSVEALLHHLVPGKFVVHTHSTVANALTCCEGGQAMAAELFGDEVVWLAFIDPGFELGKGLGRAIDAWKAKTGRETPTAILMANHGLIVSGDSPEEVKQRTDTVVGKIAARLGECGACNGDKAPSELVNLIGPALRGLAAEDGRLKIVSFDDSPAARAITANDAARDMATAGPLTPDQIVYCNSFPLWCDPAEDETEEQTIERLRGAMASHVERTGYAAKVVLVRGVGVFAIGDDVTGAANARDVYLDAVKVMLGAAKLGKVSYLTDDQRRFIEEWEVEAYRKKIAAQAAAGGRVAGKVAVVTGAAQGFGLEIAQQFAAAGGCVVLTDINEAGAGEAAAAICAEHGKGRAAGLAINVTDSASIAACLHEVVRLYGGIDVFISNAGVLKAESVKTQALKDFQFVTAVNYTGYFLCVQQASPIMARQHKACGAAWSDIIQINSKSGLQGSNRNGAYAGSKFGGIGLTQSFAMELVEDGIKVNSICPGNFFDGPLWSEPTHGLFAQYLRTGKVPGAKTVEDVKKAYEAKVPMGRGCRTEDVMRAVYYLIEQMYETGQAVPVTGGQVMLK
jgi:rhamnose utilization protein RhaD (predicted bifunctional aldolase and dehydrogenase)/NAD(P)-dependent dehydrogenase (short-subunit alcohol dehydrogenase family)